MPGKRQAGWPSLLVTYLLLRASCPAPFGPASLFARAPSASVATQEISNSARAAGQNALALKAATKHNVLVVTAHDEPRVFRRVLDHGTAGFIPESTSPTDIGCAVYHVLDWRMAAA